VFFSNDENKVFNIVKIAIISQIIVTNSLTLIRIGRLILCEIENVIAHTYNNQFTNS